MIAKNASVAPLITSENGSPPALNSSALPASPTPLPSAMKPTAITIKRPLNSMHVSTTLNFTDSATPRKLIAVRTKMNANATTNAGAVMNSSK